MTAPVRPFPRSSVSCFLFTRFLIFSWFRSPSCEFITVRFCPAEKFERGGRKCVQKFFRVSWLVLGLEKETRRRQVYGTVVSMYQCVCVCVCTMCVCYLIRVQFFLVYFELVLSLNWLLTNLIRFLLRISS